IETPPAVGIFRERLQKRIEARGLNMKAVSLKAGLGASYVRDVLHCKSLNPRRDAGLALAEELDPTPAYLWGEPDQPERPGFGRSGNPSLGAAVTLVKTLKPVVGSMGSETDESESARMAP